MIMFGPSCDPPHATRNGDGRLGGGLGDAANVGFATAVRLNIHAWMFQDLGCVAQIISAETFVGTGERVGCGAGGVDEGQERCAV